MPTNNNLPLYYSHTILRTTKSLTTLLGSNIDNVIIWVAVNL